MIRWKIAQICTARKQKSWARDRGGTPPLGGSRQKEQQRGDHRKPRSCLFGLPG